jgi:hypothetical protein
MTYRTFVRSLAFPLAFGVSVTTLGCDRGTRDASAMSTTGASAQASGAGPTVTPVASSSPVGVKRASSAGDAGDSLRPSNHAGRIPVLEYHVIGGEKNALYTRTRESFRADLEDVYKRGYRPITIAQLLDKDFTGVPVGMSPVVVVFDDASPEQFMYVERDGKLEIDSTSAIGIWLDFAKSHPGWSNRGVFCMLNGAGAGHNFFGDSPKWRGQRKEWRFAKVKWLAENGFELCAHTLWHAMLNKYSDAVVQEQIARNVMGIDSAVAGYRVRTMALPYGIWPRNRELAWRGSWTDPKTGKTHTYAFDAVLEVSGGPTLSPYDARFNPHSITRIQAIGDDIRKTLDRLDATNTRFVR